MGYTGLEGHYVAREGRSSSGSSWVGLEAPGAEERGRAIRTMFACRKECTGPAEGTDRVEPEGVGMEDRFPGEFLAAEGPLLDQRSTHMLLVVGQAVVDEDR